MNQEHEHGMPLLNKGVKEAQVDRDEQSEEPESKSTEPIELRVGNPSWSIDHVSRLSYGDGSKVVQRDLVRALQRDQWRSRYQKFITWMTMDSWMVQGAVALLARQHHIRQPNGPCCVGELHCPPAPRSNVWPLQDQRVIRYINAAVSFSYGIEFVVGHLWSWTLLAFKLNDAYNQLWVDSHCGPHSMEQWFQDVPSYSLVSNLFSNPYVFATVGGGMLGFAVMKALSTWYSLKRVLALSSELLFVTTVPTDDEAMRVIQAWQSSDHRTFFVIQSPTSYFFAGRDARDRQVLEWHLLDTEMNSRYFVLDQEGLRLLQAIDAHANSAKRIAFLRHIASQLSYYPLASYQSTCCGDSCGVLLPCGQTSSALTQIARSVVWDGSLSHNDQTDQLNYLERMVFGRWIAACYAISELAILAHAHNHRDLDQLLREGLLSRSQYDALLNTKARALAILHHLVQQPLSASTAFKKLYVSYNLWHVGHNRNPIMHLLFWPIKGWKLYAKVMLLVELYRGARAMIQAYQDKKDCQQQGRVWTYVHEIKAYDCTVCYDFNVPFGAAWKDVSCWEALLSSPQFPSTVVSMIQRVHMSAIQQADFSRQKLDDSFVQAVFPVLAQHTHFLPTIILGSEIQPVQIRFNQSASILAQALEAMNTTNLTAYWDDHPVISVFVTHFPKTLRYANFLSQPGRHLYVSGQSAAQLPTRLPVDTLSLYAPGSGTTLINFDIQYYVFLLKNSSDCNIMLSFIKPPMQGYVSLFLVQLLATLEETIHRSRLRHLLLNQVAGSVYVASFFMQSVSNILIKYKLLETLELRANYIGLYHQKSIKILAQGFRNNLFLKHLDLSSNFFGNKNTVPVEILAGGLENNQVLISLNLRANFLCFKESIKGTKSLFQALNLANNSALKDLDMSQNYLGLHGIDDIKELAWGLAHNTVLFSLNLSMNYLDYYSSDGIQEFSRALTNNTVLKILDISHNSIEQWSNKSIEEFAKNLANFSLSCLNMSDNWVGWHGSNESLWVEALSQFRGITWDLSHNYFSQKTEKALHLIALERNSTFIGLSQYPFISDILALLDAKHSYIDLSNKHLNYLDPQDMMLIAQKFAMEQSVQVLNISGNNLDQSYNPGLQGLLQSLMNITALKVLDLSNNYLFVDFLDILGTSLRSALISMFVLKSNSDFGSSSIAPLMSGLEENKALLVLDLSINQIGSSDNDVFALAQMLHHNKVLLVLDLSLNAIGLAGIQDVKIFIKGLRNNTVLQHLNLSYNFINCVSTYSQEVFYLLADALPHTRLNSLHLSYLNQKNPFFSGCDYQVTLTFFSISNTTAYQLLLAAINSTLEFMDLTGSLNTSQDQPFAAFLQPFKRPSAIHNLSQHLDASTLDLSFHPEVGQHQIADIASNLSHAHWTTLKLAWSGINDTGVELLASQLHHSRVTTVDLRYNDITNEGAQALAKALVSDSSNTLCRIPFLNSLTSAQHKTPITLLRHLLLAGNRIGPQGIDALCPALVFTSIHILEVGLYLQNHPLIATSQFDPRTCRQRTSADQAINAHQTALWNHGAAISSQEAEMTSFSITLYEVEWAVALFTLLSLMLWVIQLTRGTCWTQTVNHDSPGEDSETTTIISSVSTRPPFSSWTCCSFFKAPHRPNPSAGFYPYLEIQRNSSR